MKLKKTLLLTSLITAIVGALIILYYSTKTIPYVEYSPSFQQRGDVLTEDRVPKDISDSLFMVEVEQLQFKDEVRNELNNNKINWGGVVASGGIIISALLGILGLMFKWIDSKRSMDISEVKLSLSSLHYETKQIIDSNHTEVLKKLDDNAEQHSVIFNKLSIVEDLTVRKDIKESFRSISRNYMHYQKGNIPEKLQTLITAQSERLIELSDQIMTENFTDAIFDVAVVKIDQQCEIACRQVKELFDEEFISYYKRAQAKAIKCFKQNLKSIAFDQEFNGKYDRYKRAGEAFLDLLIPLTIAEYKKFIETKQN